MRTCIHTIGLLALAASLSYGEEAPAKPDKAKAKPNPEAMFKKLDTSADGSLSLEEFKASPRGQKDPVKAEEAFKKMDTDSKDGVSLEEFKAVRHEKGKGGKKKKEEAPVQPQ